MKKKRTALIVTVLLLFLSSCGQREEAPPSQNADTSQSEESPAEPSSEADAPESAASTGEGDTRPILTLTIPEGYTLARIGMTLEDLGVCTADQFIAAAQYGDYSEFPLIAEQQPSEQRCFNLEGYLYPDTYQIYSDDLPETIIRKMLTRMEEKVDPAIREQIAKSGYTTDEIVALASIIEKDSLGHRYMAQISSVLHNRLNTGMQLQCDVTITYVTGAIQPFITGNKDRYNAYYNTYRCAGIPAGAICNPSQDAIVAALNPAQTDYLYFVTDAAQEYYFAASWEEHEKNVAATKAESE